MKVEVRQREGQEEVLGAEVEMALAACEAHVAANEAVDLGRLDHFECRERLRDPRLERREGLRRRGHIGREDTPTYTLDRAERVHRGRLHLIRKGQHVLSQARLNDVLSGDLILRAESLGGAEEARNGTQNLLVGGDRGGVVGEGHGISSRGIGA